MGTSIKLRREERREAIASGLYKDFIGYGHDLAERADQILPASTRRNFVPIINVFDNFLSHKTTGFKDIDTPTVENFRKWLDNEGRKSTTIDTYCRVLKTVFRLGCEEMSLDILNPFDIHSGRYEKKTGALSVAELQKLKSFNLEKDTRLDMARELFMLSFYTCGMSLLSLATMRWADKRHTTIEYRTSIGGDVSYFTPTKYARVALARLGAGSKYILPLLDHGYNDSDFANLRIRINTLFRKLDALLLLSQPLSFRVAKESWTEVEKTLEYDDPLS